MINDSKCAIKLMSDCKVAENRAFISYSKDEVT